MYVTTVSVWDNNLKRKCCLSQPFVGSEVRVRLGLRLRLLVPDGDASIGTPAHGQLPALDGQLPDSVFCQFFLE